MKATPCILGIETSCDETSVAVTEGCRVLCNVIASSKKTFESLAGVIPEEAARQQVECMIPVLEKALAESKKTPKDIDLIAVTKGPGLLGSLLVGAMTARVLSTIWNKPLIGVHHTLGHLSSPWLKQGPTEADDPRFPILTLSASGGHTDLWYRMDHLNGFLIARTRDDAAGEAFDKGASLLKLPYPGGPSIAKEAEHGDPHAYEFPNPLSEEPTLDFSYSGLKTALKYLLRDRPEAASDVSNVAASYQHAICTQLTHRIGKALRIHQDVREVHLVGGVSANLHLREQVATLCARKGIRLRFPSTLAFCTDNAAMIAAAGGFLFEARGDRSTSPFITAASLPLTATLA